MELLTTKYRITALLLCIVGLLSACYYDNEEELYPQGNSTLDLRYADIQPILQANCASCHMNGMKQGNVSLEAYNDVKEWVDNGKLLCSIKHEAGCFPMPQGGAKLPRWDIDKIAAWINDGAPE